MDNPTFAIAATKRASVGTNNLFVVALIVLVLHLSAPVHAVELTEIRGLTSIKKFEGATLFAAAFEIDRPSLSWANHLEASIGVINRADDNRPFIGLGPVWRWQDSSSAAYVDFGISPTVLGGDGLDNKDLGGAFFFSSALSAGYHFDNGWTVALRLQHISNGGLNDTNPGLDLLGLSVFGGFSQH